MGKKLEKNSTLQIISKNESNKIELEQLILRTIVMKFTEKEALAYINANKSKPVQSSRYYQVKRDISDKITQEGYKITSKNGLFEQHMMRIRTLETIEKEQWVNYHREEKPMLKSAILERITNLQVYLSSAYDYIRAIIKNQEDLQLVIAKHGATELKKQ